MSQTIEGLTDYKSLQAAGWRIGWTLPALLALVCVLAESEGAEALPLSAAGLVLAYLLAVSTYTDFRWRKIPNWATYPAAAWAIALGAASDLLTGFAPGNAAAIALSRSTLSHSAAGFLVCFALATFVRRTTKGGGGDVKICAAIGALLGPSLGVSAIAWGFVSAGVFVGAWLIVFSGPYVLSRVTGLLPLTAGRLGDSTPASPRGALFGRPVPMAPFFTAGVVLANSPFLVVE